MRAAVGSCHVRDRQTTGSATIECLSMPAACQLSHSSASSASLKEASSSRKLPDPCREVDPPHQRIHGGFVLLVAFLGQAEQKLVLSPYRSEVKLSTDGQDWRTVAAATDQRGTPFEATFDPVTARYIRICSVKPDGPGGRAVLEPFGHNNLASPSRVREGRPRSGRGGSSEPAMDSTTSSAAALSGPSARLSQRESEAKVRKCNNLKTARRPGTGGLADVRRGTGGLRVALGEFRASFLRDHRFLP